MKMIKLERKNGIALIQVLLISAIISVISLYISQNARKQVAMAIVAKQKAEALIISHSTESEIIFELLTSSKGRADTATVNWNFHGDLFSFSNDNKAMDVKLSIQDRSALINLHYPDRDNLLKLLEQSGLSALKARDIVASLIDWQKARNSNVSSQKTRGGNIPYIGDFIHVESVDQKIIELLQRNATLHRGANFNPMLSPFELLSALTNSSTAMAVISERKSGTLTKNKFVSITKLEENENSIFYPSNLLKITISSSVGKSNVEKQFNIDLFPYASSSAPPFNILSITK